MTETTHAHIALVTHRAEPDLHLSDSHLLAPLQAQGYRVAVVAWDDPSVQWDTYDLVVIRSTWDYHRRHAEFSRWLQAVDRVTTLVNPLPLLRWNMDKIYLRDLQSAGVALLPTVFVEAHQPADLSDILAQTGWQQAVVKPLISAGGEDTWLVTPETAAAHQPAFDALIARDGVMVQRFAPQIAQGETSLVYFDGVYSHALLKVPDEGQIRVHEEYGGRNRAIDLSATVIAQGRAILAHVQRLSGHLPTYARVDGLVTDDTFTLMELECVEPELFFQHAPADAPEHFVQALGRALQDARTF